MNSEQLLKVISYGEPPQMDLATTYGCANECIHIKLWFLSYIPRIFCT